MDKPLDQEGGWHDFVASLEDRYVSANEHKTSSSIVELGSDYTTERHLDPVVISSIEDIVTHQYPFWRVRCKVSDWCFPYVSDMYLLTSQAQRKH